MEDKFTFVKSSLDMRRGEWAKIALKSKVSRRTINYIMDDLQLHSPTMKTVEKLYKYLKKTEGK